MPTLAADEIVRMRDAVFFEGPDASKRVSRFWVLLILAATIAAAGVVGDSTATVIGAMIVAPLMLPIQGTMLSVVLADRANLVRSIVLMVAGAAAAVAIGYLVGLLVVNQVIAETNAQVAGRVHPHLIDLLAALATGVVGSVALVRRDISDTLPGVAIAISLVPPLSVVGLTLEAGAYDQSFGALLLFLTNVAAILATGIAVMALYGVQRLATGPATQLSRRRATFVVVALVVIVAIPLTISSISIASDTRRELRARDAGKEWATDVGWDLTNVTTREDSVVIEFEGPLPVPDAAGLRPVLVAHGVNPSDVRAQFLPRETVDFDEG